MILRRIQLRIAWLRRLIGVILVVGTVSAFAAAANRPPQPTGLGGEGGGDLPPLQLKRTGPNSTPGNSTPTIGPTTFVVKVQIVSRHPARRLVIIRGPDGDLIDHAWSDRDGRVVLLVPPESGAMTLECPGSDLLVASTGPDDTLYLIVD